MPPVKASEKRFGIIYGPLIVTGFLTLADIYFGSYDVWVKSSGFWKGDSQKE